MPRCWGAAPLEYDRKINNELGLYSVENVSVETQTAVKLWDTGHTRSNPLTWIA